MNTPGTVTSTCTKAPDNVVELAGGRKTKSVDSIVASGGTGVEESVFVNLGHGDAIVFSDEVESVPSLEEDSSEDEEDSEEEYESDEESLGEDDEDKELDEGLAERLRILADCRALKNLATAFLHPEKPVEVNPTEFGRNFFERPSAPETMDDEDADEEAEILEDVKQLKEAARAYLHPEIGVTKTAGENFGRNFFDRPSAPEVEEVDVAFERARVLAEAALLKQSAMAYAHPEVGVRNVDGCVFGRNYFNRPSAPEMEEDEFADERAEILEEAAALKKLASTYMHPEASVKVDGACFGRNYFNRPSAPETEDLDEQARVLADAAALKKAAVGYLHPEIGIKSVDSTAFGRNYFNRYSAPETEEDEFADERAEILEEAAALKKLASNYMHPEAGVTADGACFGRNYFNRPSAPEVEDADECARVLADAAALKKAAAGYLHPEVGVKTTDGACFGRNYFSRYSAPEVEEDEFADERAEILEEAAALKKLASAYMHPEAGVAADGACFGRNYFNRPSAPEMEDMDERARVLADAAALKQSALGYLHPEVGVKTTDGACFGRNYFNRYSAPEMEDDEFADERAEILEEAAALKKVAAQYLHPEAGVAADGACFGRNYFDRPSAPEVEDADERALVLADAAALKKAAAGYLHPEVGVKSTDGACFGRNYFNRYSAPETEEDEFADERAEILEEAAALKKAAVQYLHPEAGVAADGACFGRNYFNRPSATEMEDAEECARVLADAAALKEAAIGYLHPEVGVKTTDGACFGRNYFNRYSAPDVEEDEFADERAEILEEAAALKKAAVQYLHPEPGVAADGACFGRNYFNRPSAPEMEDADECARVLADAAALKKSAVFYLHPEVGVKTTDGACFGRNYFNRYSAPEVEEAEFADERAEVLEEAAALKKAAVQYLHPEAGVAADGACFGRNYFNRPSAAEIEDADECARVLADAAALKKSAIGYLHPEVGIKTADGACFGRNYFNRYSAPGFDTQTGTEPEKPESVEPSKDLDVVKNLAAAVKGAGLPSTKNAKLVSSNSDLGAAKKSASSVDLFGLSEEVF